MDKLTPFEEQVQERTAMVPMYSDSSFSFHITRGPSWLKAMKFTDEYEACLAWTLWNQYSKGEATSIAGSRENFQTILIATLTLVGSDSKFAIVNGYQEAFDARQE